MNKLPRQKLREVIKHYGRDIVEDPRRCRAILLDLCAEHRREVNVLSSALNERVAADLLASKEHTPLPLLLSRLTERLHDNLALDKEAARWAVETWAMALGVAAEPELSVQGASPPLLIPRCPNPPQPPTTSS